MSRAFWRGLGLALVCGGWAGAETLEEAIDRLATAAAETRDVTVKYTLEAATYGSAAPGKKPAKTTSATGTVEFRMLREDGKTLLRLDAKITMARPGKGPSAPPTKVQETALSVSDGEFTWTQRPLGPTREPHAVKENCDARGGVGLREFAGLADMAFCRIGFKGDIGRLRKNSDAKLVGKGSVAGRPTTVVEWTTRAEALALMPEPLRASRAKRLVAELDDATGAALTTKATAVSGAVLLSLAATEVRADEHIDRDIFTYTPPDGAKVEDKSQPPPAIGQ